MNVAVPSDVREEARRFIALAGQLGLTVNGPLCSDDVYALRIYAKGGDAEIRISHHGPGQIQARLWYPGGRAHLIAAAEALTFMRMLARSMGRRR